MLTLVSQLHNEAVISKTPTILEATNWLLRKERVCWYLVIIYVIRVSDNILLQLWYFPQVIFHYRTGHEQAGTWDKELFSTRLTIVTLFYCRPKYIELDTNRACNPSLRSITHTHTHIRVTPPPHKHQHKPCRQVQHE